MYDFYTYIELVLLNMLYYLCKESRHTTTKVVCITVVLTDFEVEK